MFTCSVDTSGYQALVKKTINTIQTGVYAAARIAAQHGAAHARAVGSFKDQTGNLRKGIKAKYVSSNQYGAKWAIVSTEKYSNFVEWGTAPHDIHPKAQNGFSGPTRKGQSRRADNDVGVGRGHALRWKVGGVNHFARMVHHPGSRSHPFMWPGMFKAEASLRRSMGVIVEHVSRMWHV